MAAIINFMQQTGFYMFGQEGNWKCLIMIAISFVLLYLAIVKGFEPLLLLPIAFGMLCTNLPGADMFHEILFAGGHVHWDLFGGAPITQEFLTEMSEAGVADAVLAPWAVGSTVSLGLLDVLYLGVKLGIYPCLIFMGVGTMTDFGPLIANPKSLLLGAAAQLGIFMTYVGTQFACWQPPAWWTSPRSSLLPSPSSAVQTARPRSSSPPVWLPSCSVLSPLPLIPTWPSSRSFSPPS